MMRRAFIPTLLLVLAACGQIGNGKAATSPRALAGFTAVTNQSEASVTITQGGVFSVVVSGDENLLPLILTDVSGSTLTISNPEVLTSTLEMKVVVTLPVITELENCGSGDLSTGALETGDLQLTSCGSGSTALDGNLGHLTLASSGSGSVTVSGQGSDLTVTMTGSGSVDASGFASRGAEATVSGSGSLELNVDGNATLTDDGPGSISAALQGGMSSFLLEGSGSISWSGQTTVVSSKVTGSGSISEQ